MSTRIVCIIAMLVIINPRLLSQDKPDRPPEGGTRMMRFDATTAFIVPELGVVITVEGGKLVVKVVPTSDERPGGQTDVAEGDEVGMMNGTRVSSIARLRETYEKIAVGDDVRLGLRREGRSHIVTFPKKNPKDQSNVIVMRQSDANAEDEDVLPALGIIVRKEKENVVIAGTLPHVPAGLKEGDIITSLNGKSIKSVKDFSSEFDATAIGDELRFELLRGGKTVSLTTLRPEPRGKVIIKN
jgi:S1-C subfamily serine protease